MNRKLKYRKLSDKKLGMLWKRGNQAAGRELFDRYFQLVRNYLLLTLPDNSEQNIEKYVIDVFVRLGTDITQLPSSQEFSLWLYKHLHQYLTNDYRNLGAEDEYHEKPQGADLLSLISESRNINLYHPDSWLSCCFPVLIQSLSPIQREILVLSLIFKLDTLQISEIIKTDESAVKSMLFYAYKEIARLLLKMEDELKKKGKPDKTAK